ncbi:MAG: hypothetical protein Q8O89_05850 [Nanoarchaeota archaeon]|nr:hypothetical protein [Nanoarchaeota archaeon]
MNRNLEFLIKSINICHRDWHKNQKGYLAKVFETEFSYRDDQVHDNLLHNVIINGFIFSAGGIELGNNNSLIYAKKPVFYIVGSSDNGVGRMAPFTCKGNVEFRFHDNQRYCLFESEKNVLDQSTTEPYRFTEVDHKTTQELLNLGRAFAKKKNVNNVVSITSDCYSVLKPFIEQFGKQSFNGFTFEDSHLKEYFKDYTLLSYLMNDLS